VIRVMIVDDNPVIRRGVPALLGEADDLRLVGEAGDGREAIRVAGEAKADVVLLDVRMPVMDGVEAAGPLAERARVMMLTYTDEQERVVAAIRAGAAGYLVHGQFGADELATRPRQLAAGTPRCRRRSWGRCSKRCARRRARRTRPTGRGR
jgi:DNA-binding NarL/FixJ family response regulator